jgi:enterochelin esterase-like enzyme
VAGDQGSARNHQEERLRQGAHRSAVALRIAALFVMLAACVPAPTVPLPTPTPAAVATPTAFTPPAEVATPTPSCAEHGTWIDFQYRGAAVAGEVPARVYLPPCYATEVRRYPAAYFLHGKPYTEEQWIELGLPQLVEDAEPTLPAMILVLARQPEPLFSNSDGGPGSYETEFLDGLVASVDSAFRTEAAPEGRAVVGLSRGGVWALEIALRHPDRIGAVAALSPALAVNYARQPYDPLHLVATAESLPHRVWLGAGEDDWARAKTEALAAGLAARGAAPDLILVPGDHTDPTWDALLPFVIEFLGGFFANPGAFEGALDFGFTMTPAAG